MPGSVVVIAGPADSGKTDWLLAHYRKAVASAGLGGTLWIAPTHRSAADVRGRLLDDTLGACFRPAVMTFAQFAEQVLAASDRVVQPITDLVKRQIVRRLIRTAAHDGRLVHFRPIAGTTGLVDLATEFISELKRYEIWPDDFEQACHKRGRQQKDRELVALYRGYQDYLNQHQFYDVEGRFWTARELLNDGQTRPFDKVRCVVVDGFTDFTRTQHEILDILAERAETLHVSLPLEKEPHRADLFAKPRRTLAKFGKPQRAVTIDWRPRPAEPRWPALAHVETELFKSPRLVRPASTTAGIEVIEAARAIDELYLVGRHIKRLLVEGDPDSRDGAGVPPGDIAVVLRSPGALATLVREAFDELGLPYAIDEGRPLRQVPVAVALVALLRLHVEDWPFRSLVALLTNNYFQPEWPESRAGAVAVAADATIRSLQLARGREPLLAGLRRLASDAGDNAKDQKSARETLALVERMARAFDRLPVQASYADWARALAALAGDTGLTRAWKPGSIDPIAVRDRAAWELMIESLTASARFALGTDENPELLDGRQLLDFLIDVVHTGSLPGLEDEVGRIRVLSAASARALSIPYVFFAGMSERAFPPAERADRLYSEAEYERFVGAGLDLTLHAEASQEEMLLFYEVVTRARRRLYLSYPGLDDKGQPLLPSPYLAELEQVCGNKVARLRVEDLSPLPRADDIAGAADQRLLAVAQAVGRDRKSSSASSTARSTAKKGKGRSRAAAAETSAASVGMLASLAQRTETSVVFQNIMAGLDTIASRAERAGFGPFEGMLTSDAARTQLAKQFPLDERWSASRLEEYRGCPYRFFLARVLHVEPIEGLELSTDSMARGSALHDALARLHRELNATLGKPVSPAAPEAQVAFRQASEQLLAEMAVRNAGRMQPFQAALAEIDRRLLRQWLEEYLVQHAKYDDQWRAFEECLVPAHFEVSFGDDSPSDDPLSSTKPLVLTAGDRSVQVRGRIDRVDVGRIAGAPVFNVLDYKTGRANRHAKKAIESGDALQTFLYVLAAEQLFARAGRLPWATGYWFVSDGGYPAKQAVAIREQVDDKLAQTDHWQQLLTVNTARVVELVERIEAGNFPVVSRDEQCTSYCDFRTVCRINHIRSLEKSSTWQLTADQA
ncbi:MAG TPA: PD-(D/E)XK nuclease family protein [Pirellulales bacterium]|jgi:ATP-dependent helicase/DNAse subunit B